MQSYQDDPSILDQDILLRRVPMQPGSQIVWNANLGCWRPSSAAFKDHPDGSPMSIALKPVLDKLNLPVDHPLNGYECTHALASITAGLARTNGQEVARDALPPGDPAHGVVVGPKKRASRELARAAAWVVPPNIPPPSGAGAEY